MTDDFFGDLGKSISKYAQNAADKTNTLIESTKASAQISTETREIDKLYKKIGKLVYERVVKDPESEDIEIRAIVEEIQSHNGQIGTLKKDLADLKGMKICPTCSEVISKNVAFCPKCGAAVESENEADATPDAKEEVAIEAEDTEKDAVSAEDILSDLEAEGDSVEEAPAEAEADTEE